MSLQFSNTTTKNGIIQRIEKRLGYEDGFISGNSLRLAQTTGDINQGLSEVLSLIFKIGGTWQFDDSNHTDYPIITTNIISGQRDYSFTEDENGNLILDIYKVLVADVNGIFREITPVDIKNEPSNYWDGRNVTGQPNTYDKLGNGILLDPPANYNRTAGLKIYINREGSYFLTTDTTKMPGFAGLFHEYLVLYAVFQKLVDNDYSRAKNVKVLMDEMKSDIEEYYQKREKDNPKVMRAKSSNPH